MQTTLASALSFDGKGLHHGLDARMTIFPAKAGYGVRFERSDVAASGAARWDCVEQVALCTLLKLSNNQSISTIEHVMAALAGCGVHNALISVDGPEVPIMDGSALPFVQAILQTGVVPLEEPVEIIKVIKPVVVRSGEAWAKIEPSTRSEMDFSIEFADAAIGFQRLVLDLANGSFVRELCDSRTFCRQADVEAMHRGGLALGGTLDNAVVYDKGAVLTPGGLRHRDEAVRHKMLDAVGDLALAGAPIMGRYVGFRAGHALTNKLLREFFATPGAHVRDLCDAKTASKLPGFGVRLAELPRVA